MISRVSGDRFVRSFDPTFDPNGVVGVRRLEVITGVGGRRSWSRDDKARIVAESFFARANVSAVARRYGLRPQQVYAWRRLARQGALALPAEEEVGFVPIIPGGGEPAAAAAQLPAGGKSGYRDDRDCPCALVGLEPLSHFSAGNVRQLDVQQDQIGMLFKGQINGGLAEPGDHCRVAMKFQHVLQEHQVQLIILDDQNAP
jgi:transposase